MNKKIIVYALLSILIASTAGTGLVSLTQANFKVYWPDVPNQPITNQPTIILSSSVNNSIVGQKISIAFTIGIPDSWYFHETAGVYDPFTGAQIGTREVNTFIGTIKEVTCAVDGRWVYDNGTVFGGPIYQSKDLVNITSSPSYPMVIGALPLGPHSVTVTVSAYTTWNTPEYRYYDVSTSSTNTLMVSALPAITNLSIENKTYNKPFLPLTFNLNQTVSWEGFSLDNQANMTLDGNVTLTDLTEGGHTLVVYANDTFGNMGKSDTAYFSIILPTPSPTQSPSPTKQPTITISPTPIINHNSDWIPYAIIGIILVGIGATAVYLRRRKKGQ